MDGARFDAISKTLAQRRFGRRQALRATLAGSAGMVFGLAAESADAAQGSTDEISYLFVQAFGSSEISPKPDQPDSYTVTLSEGIGHAFYFSDRPDRIAGLVPTEVMLQRLGFQQGNDPNAALIAERPDADGHDGWEQVLMVELSNPSYQPESRALTYDVVIVPGSESLSAFEGTTIDVPAAATTFGPTHLFIDTVENKNNVPCGTYEVGCFLPGSDSGDPGLNATPVGLVGTDLYVTTEGSHNVCQPSSGCAALEETCNATYAECGGNCFAANNIWGPHACGSCAYLYGSFAFCPPG
jgi:hypothetical protein